MMKTMIENAYHLRSRNGAQRQSPNRTARLGASLIVQSRLNTSSVASPNGIRPTTSGKPRSVGPQNGGNSMAAAMNAANRRRAGPLGADVVTRTPTAAARKAEGNRNTKATATT